MIKGRIVMDEKKNGIEFSGKVIGVITALIALFSVEGTFYNNLKNYVEASGYYGYFSIDLRYVDINFYSNSYNFIFFLLILFLQFATAFFIFIFFIRIFTNKHFEKMVNKTEVRKNQQRKLKKIFYINRDAILSMMDFTLFFLFFFAVYILQKLLDSNTNLFLYIQL
ncbi:MAG: hypothetical protein J1E64_10975 [Acetatifactor sp.]|nr:hypothetical protein [Acetatifactor sp.]